MERLSTEDVKITPGYAVQGAHQIAAMSEVGAARSAHYNTNFRLRVKADLYGNPWVNVLQVA